MRVSSQPGRTNCEIVILPEGGHCVWDGEEIVMNNGLMNNTVRVILGGGVNKLTLDQLGLWRKYNL